MRCRCSYERMRRYSRIIHSISIYMYVFIYLTLKSKARDSSLAVHYNAFALQHVVKWGGLDLCRHGHPKIKVSQRPDSRSSPPDAPTKVVCLVGK